MDSGGNIGEALRNAIAQLRARIGDPTAAIGIVTRADGNGTLAKRSLAEVGQFVRVYFLNPERIVRELGTQALLRKGLRPEPAGWLSCTLQVSLRALAEDESLGEYGPMLAEPGWGESVQRAIEELESNGVTSEWLAAIPASKSIALGYAPRVLVLEKLLKMIQLARTEEGLFGPTDLLGAAKSALDTPSLPLNKIQGAIVLGDGTVPAHFFLGTKAWLEARPGLRMVLHPEEAVAPAPLGLREAAASLERFEVEANGPAELVHLKKRLFRAPDLSASTDGSVHILAAPDEVRELSEVVRHVQRAIERGTRLDRIAIALPDGASVDVLESALDKAHIPATWLIQKPMARTAEARLLRLALDVANGDERLLTWYELLRHPNLKFPKELGELAGKGRWRRILSKCGATQGTQMILQAIADWRDELDANDESYKDDHKSASSLKQAIEAVNKELSAYHSTAQLAHHARQWRRFVKKWIRASALRVRVERMLDGWARQVAGPALSRKDAIGFLDDALQAEQAVEGALTEPKIRVGPLMALLGGELDLVCVVGMAEGRFPTKVSEDPLLADALVELINAHSDGRMDARMLTSARIEDVERRRLAAAVSACGRELVLSSPSSELMTGRPVRPGRLLLDVVTALQGNRAKYADLADRSEKVGSRAWTAPEDPNDALGVSEYSIARLARDGKAALALLGNDPVARRLLELHRSLEKFRRGLERGEPVFDAWTGQISPDLLPNPITTGEPTDAGKIEKAVLRPGEYFLTEILEAYKAPRIERDRNPCSESVIDQRTISALQAALDAASSDLKAEFAEAYEKITAEEGAHQPEVEAWALALATRLGNGRFAKIIAAVPELATSVKKTQPERSVDESLPWKLAESEVQEVDGELLELRGKGSDKKSLNPDEAFSLVIEALANRGTGSEYEKVRVLDSRGQTQSMPLVKLVDDVLTWSREGQARAADGVWPSSGSFSLSFSQERGFDPKGGSADEGGEE